MSLAKSPEVLHIYKELEENLITLLEVLDLISEMIRSKTQDDKLTQMFEKRLLSDGFSTYFIKQNRSLHEMFFLFFWMNAMIHSLHDTRKTLVEKIKISHTTVEKDKFDQAFNYNDETCCNKGFHCECWFADTESNADENSDQSDF